MQGGVTGVEKEIIGDHDDHDDHVRQPLQSLHHSMPTDLARPPSGNGLRPPQVRDAFTPPPQKPLDMEDMAICASPGDVKHSPVRRKKAGGRPDSLAAMIRRGMVDHQLGLSVNIMLFVGLSFIFFPALRERMSAFFSLSYPSERHPGMYGPGSRDLYLVASFIVFFTALRAFCLDYVLAPVSRWCGITKKKAKTRFVEQSYMMVYYVIYWTIGLLLFIRDTPKDVRNVEGLLISLWTGYPKLWLDAGMKLYYLSQFAFWIQQVVVLNIEEHRKDHYQMLTHHFITILLLAGSYSYRQWRVGNAVLVCMDLVDFIFPLAKILKYLGMQTACDAAFAAFVVSWLASRHVAYLTICWSIYAHVNSAAMPYGLYSIQDGARLSADGGTNILDNLLQPILHPDAKTVSFNANIRWLFLGLLLALQGVTLVWFAMIVRVVLRVLRGEGADDTRSEGEDEGEDVEGTADFPAQPSDHLLPEQPRYIEVEATSTEEVMRGYNHAGSGPKRAGNGAKRKSKGISSGLNLGEHKDILNRIGCLSEEQLAREREKREESASPSSTNGGSRK